MPDLNRWWVIVPMKDTRLAKSRPGGAHDERRQLAIVMARDTLCAAVNADCVEGVVAVCDREEDVESFALPGVTVVVREGLTLNEAIVAGGAVVRAEDASRNLAVIPGDLPYLRSAELDAALGPAAASPAICVGDRTGRGTTLTTARGGTDLLPAYGDDSLARHREAGAVELGIPAWSGLRRDVDVPEDLIATYAFEPAHASALGETLRPGTGGSPAMKQVGVVGGALMGCGIVEVHARAGLDVVIAELSAQAGSAG